MQKQNVLIILIELVSWSRHFDTFWSGLNYVRSMSKNVLSMSNNLSDVEIFDIETVEANIELELG